MPIDDNSLQVKRLSLVDAVVEQMIEAIKNGQFKPGEKIPSEKILTKEFGVSRTTLREAFKKLENIGAISIRQGSGTYLLDSSEGLGQEQIKYSAPEVLPLSELVSVHEAIRAMFSIGNYQLTHYLEARECIENTAIKLAVERITEKDISAIENILAKQSTNPEPEVFLELDYEFHSQIIMASKNEFLYQFWLSMSPFVREQIARTSIIPGMILSAFNNHKKILSAIIKGDIPKARALNIDHLRIIQGRMLSEAVKRVGAQSEEIQ